MSTTTRNVIHQLVTAVGATLTKVITGTERGDDYDRWIQGSDAPSKEQVDKMNFTLKLLASFENPEDARQWLIKETVYLTKKGWPTSPAQAIALGYVDEVEESLHLVQNGYIF